MSWRDLSVAEIMANLEMAFVADVIEVDIEDDRIRTWEHPALLETPLKESKVWAVRVEAKSAGFRDAGDLRQRLVLKGILHPVNEDRTFRCQTHDHKRELLSESRKKKHGGKDFLETSVPSDDLWVFFLGEEEAAAFRSEINAYFLDRMQKVANAFAF